jgi:hypothetical protein
VLNCLLNVARSEWMGIELRDSRDESIDCSERAVCGLTELIQILRIYKNDRR